MLKKTVLLIACVFLAFSNVVFAAEQNAIKNNSFEKGAIFPDGWDKKMYDTNDASEFIWEKGGGHSGDRYVTIVNNKENHARLTQAVNVKPDTNYKLSCWVKAEGCPTGKKGAGIGVEGVALGPASLCDTDGKWQYFEMYGLTGKKQNSIELSVTVGGYGNTNTGKGSFDDVAVEEVSQIPQNAQVYDLSVQDNVQSTVSSSDKKIPGDIFNMLSSDEWTFIAIIVLVIYILFAIYYLYFYKPRKASKKILKGGRKGLVQSNAAEDKEYMKYLYIILGLGLLLRLAIAPVYAGYNFDYGMFKYWATTAAGNLFGMYHPGAAYIDYPPVYIMVLAFIGTIFKTFNIAEGTPLFITILKLPAIFADVLTAYIIFTLAKSRLDVKKALILTALYIFNPLIWFDTVVWGQVDSVFFLTLIAIFMFILQKRYVWATVFMAISVLTKPQGIIFGPVLLFEMIMLVKDKQYKTVLKSLGAGALVTIAIIMPFTIGNSNPLWLYDLLFKMTGTWQFASVNAFNFFALVGANWKEDYKTFILFTYKTWGDIFIVVTVLFTGFIYWKSRNKYTLFFAALILDVFTFTLSSRMHERYLYPATVIVLFIYIFLKERRALDIFIATSVTNFLNIFVSFISIASSGDLDNYGALCRIPPYNPILMLSSFINVCVLVYTVKFVIDVALRDRDRIELVKSDL